MDFWKYGNFQNRRISVELGLNGSQANSYVKGLLELGGERQKGEMNLWFPYSLYLS